MFFSRLTGTCVKRDREPIAAANVSFKDNRITSKYGNKCTFLLAKLFPSSEKLTSYKHHPAWQILLLSRMRNKPAHEQNES